MRKKLFTFLLVIVASIGSIFAASGTCGENLTWDLTDGVLTISGTGAMTDYSDSYSVPWDYYRSSVNSVLINDGVTSIGGYAFYYCNKLTSVTIPNSVTSIGTYAFYYCRKLESIAIPNSVTSIESSAFYDCSSLASVEISNSVTNIGNSAFSGCSSLTSIEIPNSVTNIGNSAFSGCSSLTSVTIGNSVTSIGSGAFSGCSSLTSIVIPNSVTNIGDQAFSRCSSLSSVTIPNSVTEIGSSAFDGCSSLPVVDFLLYADTYLVGTIEKNLPSYTIKEGTKWIGNRAFEDCSNMTSVIIPNSVTRIGDYAFSGCTSLPVENNLRYADTYLVEAVDESLSTYTIKEGTKWIGSSAFSYCRSLTSIEIPNSVTSIGRSAFSGCSGLTSIEIPNSVTSIGGSAFYDCSGLTSIEIPNSVTSIGSSAFRGCTGLTSIEIPSSVTSIGSSAFSGCSGLTSIEIPNSVTSIGGSAFYNVPNIVYSGSATGSPWGARSVNGYVEGWLVYEDASKTSLLACSTAAQGEIVMPNSVTSIGEGAFSGCSALTSLTIPNSVTSIGNDAFSGCFGLPVENNLRYADTYLVGAVDKSLSSYTIKEGTRWIGNGALKNCSKLTSVNISSSVQFIEDEAFQDCGLLDSVVIPDNVTSIGKQAFYRCGWRCDNVMFVSIGNSVTSIGERAFAGLKMTSVTIPNSVTSIGDEAFYGCSVLTSVTIPNSVTSIGNSAFASCSSLNKIYSVSQNPPSISSNTFRNIPATSSVYVPRIARPTYKSDQYWTKLNIVGIGGETETSVLATSVIINASNELWEVVSDYIVSIGIEGGEQQAGNVLEYIGLDPNSEYKDVPVVLTANTGETETVNVSFTTTALELTTKPSQPVSSTVAILLAETNMSDAETSCGFEYKRNDAPADMDGTKVYCPVASGTMAGRLKNLKDDVYYKYRAFYQSAAGKMYYGDWQYIFTGDVAVEFDPVLYTYTATAVTETTATISGYALAGATDFAEQGFEYWAESRVDVQGDNVQSTKAPLRMQAALGEHFFVQASGINMHVTLTNLDAGTVYKYRAYGKVGEQYYYGSEQSFTTRGTYTPPTYTITFVNWDGTELQSSQVTENAMPEYNGETPTRPETAAYTYTFKGWTPEIVAATANATYTATYTATAKHTEPVYYIITFINWDETVLQVTQVEEGEKPEYTGETPTRPEDENYTYTFNGWSPSIQVAWEDATYMATFTAEEKSEDISNVQGDNAPCTKVLRDGQIFILRGEKVFTLTGQEVK